jgi:hypothetical protein
MTSAACVSTSPAFAITDITAVEALRPRHRRARLVGVVVRGVEDVDEAWTRAELSFLISLTPLSFIWRIAIASSHRCARSTQRKLSK